MKIIPANYLPEKDYHLEDDIDFSNADLSAIFNLNKINDCHVSVDINNYEDILVLSFKIVCNLTLVSSYSLKEFVQKYTFNESIDFSFNNEDEDYTFIIKDSTLDLDPFILDIIVTNIPSKVFQKGEKLPTSGSGYQVLSEEEYLKEKENKKDDRWSKLDDLDL